MTLAHGDDSKPFEAAPERIDLLVRLEVFLFTNLR